MVRHALLVLASRRDGLQGLRGSRSPGSILRKLPEILSWAFTLLQRPLRDSSRRLLENHRSGLAAAPPVRFLPLQRLASPGQRLHRRAFHGPTASAFRFSQPHDASTAQSLLALFHANSALGVRPPELSSSQAGGNRLRHRYPHAVGFTRRYLMPADTPCRRSLGSAPQPACSRIETRRASPDFRVLLRTESPPFEPVV